MSAIANGLALHGGFIPYVGHVPHVLRLRAQRAAHGRADEAAHDLRLHARLDRPGRGRPDAPVGRARGQPAPHPGHGPLAAVRHGRDRASRGSPRSNAATARRACCSRARTCPFLPRDAGADRGDRAAAATCSPTSDAASPARGRAHRHRLRGGARAWPRATRSPRTASPCASCRCPARASSTARTPRYRASRAAARRAARRRRGRRHRLLAQVRRRRRRSARRRRRHRHVRRIGAGAGAVQALRLHGRARRRGRAAALVDRQPEPRASIDAPHVRRHPSAPPRPPTRRAIAQVRVDAWRTTYRGMIPDAYLAAHEGRGQHGAVGQACSPRRRTPPTRSSPRSTASVTGFASGCMLAGAEARPRTPSCPRSTSCATRSARGIGRRLVAAVAAAQRAHGATGLIVWVIAGNKAARAFYEGARRRTADRAAVHVGRHGPGRGRLRLARPAPR